MSQKDQHHQKHDKEREQKKKEERKHEKQHEKNAFPIHPAWLFTVGTVLVLVAVLIWTVI
jgi:hypothetical protein